MSEDHKPDCPDEKKRILEYGGFVEDNRINGALNLSRSIGDLDYKKDKKLVIATPEVTKFEINK